MATSTPLQPAATHAWACAACTFLNCTTLARCEVCASPGPAAAPRSRKRARGSGAEARGARFLPKPSRAVRERIERAFSHRLYLLDASAREEAPSGWHQEFVVLGATGNAYEVTICRQPRCTCPDAAKGNVCKHRLFVMLRVLRCAPDDAALWQRALLESEVRALLSGGGGGGDRAALAAAALRDAYRARAAAASAPVAVHRAIADCCGVCFDALAEEAAAWCAACGNALHAACLQRWLPRSATCVYCRAPWRAGGGDAADAPYINLRDVSEEHREGGDNLDALYPDTARWIVARAAGGARRARGGGDRG